MTSFFYYNKSIKNIKYQPKDNQTNIQIKNNKNKQTNKITRCYK